MVIYTVVVFFGFLVIKLMNYHLHEIFDGKMKKEEVVMTGPEGSFRSNKEGKTATSSPMVPPTAQVEGEGESMPRSAAAPETPTPSEPDLKEKGKAVETPPRANGEGSGGGGGSSSRREDAGDVDDGEDESGLSSRSR